MYGYFQKSIYGIYFTFPIIRSGGWESDLLYRVLETRKKPDPPATAPPHPCVGSYRPKLDYSQTILRLFLEYSRNSENQPARLVGGWGCTPAPSHVGVCRFFQRDRGDSARGASQSPPSKNFPRSRHKIHAIWSRFYDQLMLYLTKTNAHAFACVKFGESANG